MTTSPNTAVARTVLPYAFFLTTLFLTPLAHALDVTPRSEVRDGVTARAEATSESERVGVLRPGQRAILIGAVPSWHEVRLPDGTQGFVPKRWTEVAVEGPGSTPFEVHFLDVGTGDSAILDVGDREMVIDGGESVSILADYAFETGLISSPIELAVVTHADSDHWKGLPRLLNFDGRAHEPIGLREFWEPGYDRACRPLASYDTFIADVRSAVPAAAFRRPLSVTHVPAVDSGTPAPITVPSLPGVRITVLHSDPEPVATDCGYQINNASVVLMVEVDGVRILFTGDANGKERAGASTVVGHVEQKLLALAAQRPSVLRADILKVPHHGSETASTDAFIAAVDPRFVVISASTRHELPRDTVVARYAGPGRTILRTDRNEESANDHIICGRDANAELTCQYSEP